MILADIKGLGVRTGAKKQKVFRTSLPHIRNLDKGFRSLGLASLM